LDLITGSIRFYRLSCRPRRPRRPRAGQV